MKSGTALALGFAVVTLVAGVSIYVLQGFVYYHRVDDLKTVQVGGRDFAVSAYEGLDNKTLPLRLRGCFKLDDPAGALAAGAPVDDAEPFEAPFWFDCWDPEKIDNDVKAGRAEARIAETDSRGEFKFERLMVIYPDGRAYQWRRLVNEE